MIPQRLIQAQKSLIEKHNEFGFRVGVVQEKGFPDQNTAVSKDNNIWVPDWVGVVQGGGGRGRGEGSRGGGEEGMKIHDG